MKKKNILIISGAGFLAVTGFAMAGFALKPAMALAEGEEEEVSEVVEEEENHDQEIVVETLTKSTNAFKEIWEGYLLPAILSVNIGSIVATIASIVLAIKNHKNHKAYTTEIKGIVELVIALSKQMADYVMLLAERNEKVNNLLIALSNANEVAEKQIALIDEEKASFVGLKTACIALINLETELAKSNPEFVKNGMATQLIEIKTRLLSIVG